MAIGAMKLYKLNPLHLSSFHSIPSSLNTLEELIEAAVKTKAYHQIPDLLITATTTATTNKGFNPFSFLSTFSQPLKTQIVDEMLQSFIPIRPRSRPHIAYAYLLSHTLENPNPLPLALAILQRTLRSGSIPTPQTHLSLSSAWLHHRQCCLSSNSVNSILAEMRSIGYRPDCGTCNYLLSSLCAVDQLEESVNVLKGMSRAGCDPDSESYGIVIKAMSEARRTDESVELVREMVRTNIGVTLRQGTVTTVVAAMRANGEVRKAVELVRWLERVGFGAVVGFEGYEIVVKGCLEKREFVLAGNMVMEMVEKGFIPYIGVRQRVFEGLVSVGEAEFASIMRQKLAELRT